MINSTCLQSPDDNFIRKDYFIDVLKKRFGEDIAEFLFRMQNLCDDKFNAAKWFRPYDNRKTVEQFLNSSKLPWDVRFTSENKGVFVFVERCKNDPTKYLHTRIFCNNQSYYSHI